MPASLELVSSSGGLGAERGAPPLLPPGRGPPGPRRCGPPPPGRGGPPGLLGGGIQSPFLTNLSSLDYPLAHRRQHLGASENFRSAWSDCNRMLEVS